MAGRVEQWGALQVDRGRLWLGRPYRRLTAMPSAIGLEPAALHCYSGRAPLSRRRTAWHEISSIRVGLTADSAEPWGSWNGALGGKFDGIGLEWAARTPFNRYIAVASVNWEGELPEFALLGTQRLLEALCRCPAMRATLASEASVVDLLGRLAAARDIEEIEAILRPRGDQRSTGRTFTQTVDSGAQGTALIPGIPCGGPTGEPAERQVTQSRERRVLDDEVPEMDDPQH